MAKNRIGLQFDGWEDYISKLDELSDSKTVKKAVEKSLIASKEIVNPKIASAMHNLPAGGKYSRPFTINTIDKNMNVEWDAFTGGIDIGFDFSKSGLTSIFLMYGTPRMQPVQGLYDAIYGRKTKNEIKQVQEQIITKAIDDVMRD